MIDRDRIELNADKEEVFKFISKGGISNLGVTKVDLKNSVVVLKSSMSAFSFGEKIELIINESKDGTIVSFRGSSVHPLNITSDVKGILGTVINALRKRFEVI
jgi:hypothetical protein